jgi:hypothetical protein
VYVAQVPPPDPSADPSLRATLRTPRWLVPPVLAVVGLVLAVATSGAPSVVGICLVGAAVVLVVSLVFLEVGYSEDRARARGEYGPPPPPGREH